ncbi:MAG: response regulator [Deltaproteobacteria bacterium]|nr:response regulator [Deltaproteobacteria bacterium]
MADSYDILLVDDSLTLTRLVAAALAGEGLKVAIINKSTEVATWLTNNTAKLLLIDIMMPELDGFQLLDQLNELGLADGKQVVFISSKLYDVDKEQAFSKGAVAFIDKNTTFEAVKETVMAIVNNTIKVTFWGVRGSIPAPAKNSVQYGGNTSCVEVRLGSGSIIVFDAGTGIRELGKTLNNQRINSRIHIFLTHQHWDHIQGFPFFKPAFKPGNKLTLYSGQGIDTQRAITGQMDQPYFPIPLRTMGASVDFRNLAEREYSIDDFKIRAINLLHPGKTLGYRLTKEDKSIAYITDNELPTSGRDLNAGELDLATMDYYHKLTDFCQGVDLLIHDSQYTNEEYQAHRGWGHSTFQAALELALDAKVKRFALYHYDPDRTDDQINEILQACQEIIDHRGAKLECLAAAEGLEIII